jgi:hypothetical protein
MSDIIWFYWDGHISESRLKILHDSVYSTRVFNPNHVINVVSNSLQQSQFDNKFNINVLPWDETFFEGIPISKEKLEQYRKANPREFSDLFRLVLLYQFGGSYIDTDDLCIASIRSLPNTVCRSYDPHTSHYNKLKPEECVPGYTREIRGYDEITMFPRNDCWQNWNPKSPFIWDMLNNPKFQQSEDVVYIGGDFSWQSISNETCIKWLPTHNADWNFALTLLYLFEDFVGWSSFYDRCHHGGEMCDIWAKLPQVNDYKWGEYKCIQEIGKNFYNEILEKYPYVSHLWLHSKDMKEEWMGEIDKNNEYSISTWILNDVREKINEWK